MLNRLVTYLQHKLKRLVRKGFEIQIKDAYAPHRRKPVNIDMLLTTPKGYIYSYF